ncbi:group II intron reverse transcriptase/maturase [Paenibacillus aestuarii]|uniref:Group II intron reverse transcriptase/maturase n=1 Tax=Paenibacillus aestuarii TaxID=516965 RepID=A0ABW0K8N2_9BACL
MVQKFDYPKSETELRILLDRLYNTTHEIIDKGVLPSIKGLLEIISSEPVILSAIHKIKSNKGSRTPGADGETIRDILECNYDEVLERVRNNFKHYKPQSVRRKWIPKPGKSEMRPLGIPAIADRIIQECVRLVLEPILEAQFFQHSYGFRPMRDAHMALERASFLTHHTGYHWIVEGDISKFFDNVNHGLLLRKLWSMGIRDRRVLMIIKGMLKAGVLNEMKINPMGTPQGGIISPLLANVYLHKLDQWITREWEDKKTRVDYKRNDQRIYALRKRSNLKPAYLVRYADDWILITDSKSNAEKWKIRISKYLQTNLKLKLSDEKTYITNIKKKPINFVGFELKLIHGKAQKGFITRTKPNRPKLKAKVKELRLAIREIKKVKVKNNLTLKETLIDSINQVNAKIRGVIQYYEASTGGYAELKKYSFSLNKTGLRALKPFGGKLIAANETNNLLSVHEGHMTKIPSLEYLGLRVGLTSLAFFEWKKTLVKNPEETPYSPKGRELYIKRTGNKQLLTRADELLSLQRSRIIGKGLNRILYNFEYFLNRAYAFNRDKGKCRVCGDEVNEFNVHIHHIRPYLLLSEVNRVPNLATVHVDCHKLIHAEMLEETLPKKILKKVTDFRDKLKTPI